MVSGLQALVPNAKVGHIGLYRDHETLQPHEYYCKLPDDIEKRLVILVDPMLATGGSAVAAVNFIKARGCSHIKLMSIIAAPEGVKTFTEAHPDVELYCGCVDKGLNEIGYIVPGLGDAGDRIFGTK
jgi:uracil phosphoribosyltransferase